MRWRRSAATGLARRYPASCSPGQRLRSGPEPALTAECAGDHADRQGHRGRQRRPGSGPAPRTTWPSPCHGASSSRGSRPRSAV